MPQTEIFINRCVDHEYKHVLWVANEFHPEERRSYELYVGGDVNGAINAAVEAGMPRENAVSRAKAVLARKEFNDEIK